MILRPRHPKRQYTIRLEQTDQVVMRYTLTCTRKHFLRHCSRLLSKPTTKSVRLIEEK